MKTKLLIFSTVLTLILSSMMVNYVAAKPFYEGKTIKIIVAFKPGGGSDFYARLIARYMEKYLPGSTFIVKNVPGAGSVIGCNTIYASKPDGLTFGTFSRALPVAQLVGIKGIKFDMTKVSWLGSPSSEIYGLYMSSDKFKGLDDIIKAEKLRMATDGMGSINYITTLLFFRMMGLDNYSFGTGYSGSELDMAVVRGEMDGVFGSYFSRQAIVTSGDARAIVLIGEEKPEGLENIPYIQEIITDKKHKPVIDFLIGLNTVGRPFVGPPGIPKDRLSILQEAFKKAIHDPEGLALAKKANKPIIFISPEACEKWIEGIFNLSQDVIKLLKEGYGIK